MTDAANLHDAIQDDEIVRWLGITQPYTIEDAKPFIAAAGDRWAERAAAHFVIDSPPTGDFLGYVGILDISEKMREVECVYWVQATARGRGVTRAALRLALNWVHDSVAPDRIELSMVAGNEPSARVAVACGFDFVELRKGAAWLDGERVDEQVYVFSKGNPEGAFAAVAADRTTPLGGGSADMEDFDQSASL